jgi:hypothetical protein
MNRRGIITLFGGAVAWPLAARAQRADKVYRVGYLGLASAAAQATRMKALREGLAALGYIEGKNIVDTDALRIELGDAAQVLDDRLVKVTREVNKCGLGASLDLSKVNWRQLVIEFDFLDPDDGCVIEIFHTDSGNKPKLIGTIRGMPGGFKNYKQLFPPPGYILPGASAVGVLALGYGVYAYNAGNITNGPTFILLGAILVTLSIGMLILLRRRHPKALSMPEFTRPFVMSPD